MSYRPTIGLEIHAELATKTKMFCSCKNDPDEVRPNVNVCPICLAHPGTLPTINKEAVQQVLRIGAAVEGVLADYSEFDRKSYFYPDIPKGFQISQYAHPLVAGGSLADVALTRIHLEEDTARSTHGEGKSLIDFNRAGVPLMELVTEPVIHDAKTAAAFARELQLLLRTLGASEANLEKGEMRIEANVSVGKGTGLGTKVEVKNLNSFRSVERAIAYEVKRQTALLEKGSDVTQETRGWDEAKEETFSQRLKEGSADYRYFPEPDLPKLVTSEVAEWSKDALRATLPELPWARRARYASRGLTHMGSMSTSNTATSFFDAVAPELGSDPALLKLAENYLISDLKGEPGEIQPLMFAKVIRMLKSGELSSRGAKDLFVHMKEGGGDPELLSKQKGLAQVSDPHVLQTAVKGILEANPDVVADYKRGKAAALQYLVGQAMKASKGAGNPTKIKEILQRELGK